MSKLPKQKDRKACRVVARQELHRKVGILSSPNLDKNKGLKLNKNKSANELTLILFFY